MVARSSLLLCLLAACGCAGYCGVAAPRSAVHAHARQPLHAARRCWAMADAAADEPEASDADVAAEAAEVDVDVSIKKPAPKPAAADDDDLLSSAAFLKQKLKVLEKELATVQTSIEEAKGQADASREEWVDKRTRLQTDMDNFRARHYNQTIDAQLDARIKLLGEFLPVLDNFDRARDSIKPEGEAAEKMNGEYSAMQAALMEALDGLGVAKIPTVGEEFDYNLHMAIQQVPPSLFGVAPRATGGGGAGGAAAAGGEA